MAVASLVLGIIALISMWIPFVNLASLSMAILGIILGVTAKKKMEAESQPTGLATAGIVLCIVAAVLTAIGITTCIICTTWFTILPFM